MKIMLATDGSPCSQPAIQEVCERAWPSHSEVLVVTVVHAPLSGIVDPLFIIPSFHETMMKEDRERAPARVEEASRQICQSRADLQVHTKILEGVSQDEIVGEAESWGADLILMGSHHYGALGRFLHRSVSKAVVARAPCSVEIVRCSHQHDESVETEVATEAVD